MIFLNSISSAWVKVYGDDSFVINAFTYARKYAPKDCRLVLNDYNGFLVSKTYLLTVMANNLKELGVIDGIGMQSHLDIGFPSAQSYSNTLKKFLDTGLDYKLLNLI